MLKITYNNIAGFQFFDKIRIVSSFYHFNSITNQTHK